MANTKYKTVFMKGRPVPKLCECGGYKIVSQGENVASFFFDPKHAEYVCCGCGRVLNRYGE